MTRSDQILTITADVEGMMRAKGYTNHYAEAFADGFHEGAVWADANPQWHKNDELPEEEGLYLVMRQDIPIILYWNADEQCWDDPEEDDFVCTPKGVIAWMELPQLPKFDWQ